MDPCAGGVESCVDKDVALKLKVAALFVILAGSAVGVSIPLLLGKKCNKKDGKPLTVMKAFAAGVILATAFVHVLPDAFESLNNECLKENPWANFPFAGFVCMLASLVTLLFDCLATSCYHSTSSSGVPHVHNHQHVLPVHEDEQQQQQVAVKDDGGEEDIRHRVVSQVLEMGIVAHSVIIGITLGASQVPCTIRPLFGALTFHQFFEGIGLGGCIALGKFSKMSMTVMALAFAVTTPLGIAIGIGISTTYNENSQEALIIQGLFDAASSGILIYMALVDLIATDFLSHKMRKSVSLQVMSYVALFLGAGAMSLIAKWA